MENHMTAGTRFGFACIAACFAAAAAAQSYPTRPIRLIVPYPAGGPTDFVGRTVAQKMSESLGKIHWAGTLVCMNVVFMPMFLVGLAGVSRRLYDGGAAYDFAQPVLHFNVVSSWGAWIMALFQIPFIFNFFWSIWKGERTDANPWQATTLEWAAPSPPPHGNFTTPPQVYRGPYEYSVPGAPRDFVPQSEA